ncbi:hypothetical protein [Halomonas stenophila]|uniref:Uncharacterized protein n=1 Tax=Halomonas stenophila TaxID=795312 RepID=A0A7W5EVQ6_9GAMM|nr:hypothetical protein [Halomonas stenophila]MBB3232352.1 hypothetical protein [Halomonas stenophila]
MSIRISSPATLRLQGRSWAFTASEQLRLRGRLLDGEARRVAASPPAGGGFLLGAEVSPGDYLLEVEGYTLGTRSELETSRYQILMILE